MFCFQFVFSFINHHEEERNKEDSYRNRRYHSEE